MAHIILILAYPIDTPKFKKKTIGGNSFTSDCYKTDIKWPQSLKDINSTDHDEG